MAASGLRAIETGWGPIPVSDAHVHFFSHRFFELLASQREDLSAARAIEILGWRTPPADPVALADLWTSEFARHGVSRGALIASHPGDVDSVAAAIAAHPARFAGHFMFDPSKPGANAAPAFACGLRCVCLFPALHHYSMHDAGARAAIEEAARHRNSAVFVHCGTLSIGVRKKLGLKTVYDARHANPLDLMALAQEFPQVPFVIPHFGAGLFREALLLASQCPNVYLDTSSSNNWMAAEGLDLRAVFKRALDTAGPDRLLFGTDSSFFPRGWNRAIFDAQATALYELGIDDGAASRIFGENFDRLFPA